MANDTRNAGNNADEELRMPDKLPSGNIPTLNGYGTSFPNLVMANEFIRDAAENDAWGLDLGCAYGIHTIQAIKHGARVVANDLDSKHLKILRKMLPPELALNLRTRAGAFERITLPADSIGCVLAANVLHFMDGSTVDRVIKKMHKVLRSGGKVYANVWSPYIHALKDFIPEFERRKAANQEWPGFFEGINRRMGPLMPDHIHVFDIDVMSAAFSKHGFVVDECTYLAQTIASRTYDGREVVVITARKP
jgi:SAM-dependent methyltransferase